MENLENKMFPGEGEKKKGMLARQLLIDWPVSPRVCECVGYMCICECTRLIDFFDKENIVFLELDYQKREHSAYNLKQQQTAK